MSHVLKVKSTAMTGICLGMALAVFSLESSAKPLDNTVWTLKGKFKGSASVKCAFGGARKVPIRTIPNLSATIALRDNGSFEWSNDSQRPMIPQPGQWTQSRNALDLDFAKPSEASFVYMYSQIFAGVPVGSGTFSPSKYDFSGKTNASGTRLEITEKGGFDFEAGYAVGGGANSCKYKIRIERVYKGTKN